MKIVHDRFFGGESAGLAPDKELDEDGCMRFGFGKNWSRFLGALNQRRVVSAEHSLVQALGRDAFSEKDFLDIGCGSGLFSLAARRLGARVTSFDYDPDSVLCAERLRTEFCANDSQWRIMRGSILDPTFVQSLGQFDIVYAWGVLHHTGDQWGAIVHAMALTKPGGRLFVALYNDQGWLSRYWIGVKWIYNRAWWARPLLIAVYTPYFIGLRAIVRRLTDRTGHERGMSLWYDMIDWIGGWPFEVASPDRVLAVSAVNGFHPLTVRTVGRRQGCNEYVLIRDRPEILSRVVDWA